MHIYTSCIQAHTYTHRIFQDGFEEIRVKRNSRSHGWVSWQSSKTQLILELLPRPPLVSLESPRKSVHTGSACHRPLQSFGLLGLWAVILRKQGSLKPCRGHFPCPGRISGVMRQPPAAASVGCWGLTAALFWRSSLGTITASWPWRSHPHTRPILKQYKRPEPCTKVGLTGGTHTVALPVGLGRSQAPAKTASWLNHLSCLALLPSPPLLTGFPQ